VGVDLFWVMRMAKEGAEITRYIERLLWGRERTILFARRLSTMRRLRPFR